jgi:hypothetical protein
LPQKYSMPSVKDHSADRTSQLLEVINSLATLATGFLLFSVSGTSPYISKNIPFFADELDPLKGASSEEHWGQERDVRVIAGARPMVCPSR